MSTKLGAPVRDSGSYQDSTTLPEYVVTVKQTMAPRSRPVTVAEGLLGFSQVSQALL